MKISKIQPTQINPKYNSPVKRFETPPTKPQTEDTIAFRGKGDGLIIGVGAGTITTLLATGLLAIAGTLVLPAALAGLIVGGGALAGGVAGVKIEDKIEEKHKQENK